jgi:N-acetylglucosaminyl-diphospho-decaprenol L-rhamnosyltransferase
MHVAIAIVGFRNAEDISACLRALALSTHADFEVVICENGGAAAFEALKAIAPERLAGGQGVRLIMAPGNLGFAGGVNLCIANTPEADAWWLLNPDAEPAPVALAAMVERLAAGDCDAVGSTLIYSHHYPLLVVQAASGGCWRPWSARNRIIGLGALFDDGIDVAAVERSQNYIHGASMLIGRRFLQTVGPMREDYFLYCEEVAWGLSGLRRGMRLGWAPSACVIHRQGTTTGAGGPMASRSRLPVYLEQRNSLLLTRDFFGWRFPVAAVASLAILSLRCVRARAWRQWRFGFSGWLAGVRNERGAPAWAEL